MPSACSGSLRATTPTRRQRCLCSRMPASRSRSCRDRRPRAATHRSIASGCDGPSSSRMAATSPRAAPAPRCSRASWPKAASTASSRRSRARASLEGSCVTSSCPTARRSPPTRSSSPAVRGSGACSRTSSATECAPPGDQRFTEPALPVWADHGAGFIYGIPGNEWRGFKVADDTRGPAFDPTTGERLPTPERLKAARQYLAFRFPGLKDAPLVEARVCQYENSPDEHFIIDRHPTAENTWLVGGGSGHGFKHGPAVGELVAQLVLAGAATPPEFRLSRLDSGARPRG